MVLNDIDAHGMDPSSIPLGPIHQGRSSLRPKPGDLPLPGVESTPREGKWQQKEEDDEPTPAGSERSIPTATTAGESTRPALSRSESTESTSSNASYRGETSVLPAISVPVEAISQEWDGAIVINNKWKDIMRNMIDDPAGERRSPLQKMMAKIGRHRNSCCLGAQNRLSRCCDSCRNICRPVKEKVIQHGRTVYYGVMKLARKFKDGDDVPMSKVPIPMKCTLNCLPKCGNRAPKVSLSVYIPQTRVCKGCVNWNYKCDGKDQMRFSSHCAQKLIKRWVLVVDERDSIMLDTRLWSSIPKEGMMIVNKKDEFDLVRNHIQQGRLVLRSRVESRWVGSVIDVTASENLYKARVILYASHEEAKAHGPLKKICQFDDPKWAEAMGTGNLLREGLLADHLSEWINKGGENLSEDCREALALLPNHIQRRMAETFKMACQTCREPVELFKKPTMTEASHDDRLSKGKELLPTGPLIRPDFLDPEDVRLATQMRLKAEILRRQRAARARLEAERLEEEQYLDGSPGPMGDAPQTTMTGPTPEASDCGDDTPSKPTNTSNPSSTLSINPPRPRNTLGTPSVNAAGQRLSNPASTNSQSLVNQGVPTSIQDWAHNPQCPRGSEDSDN
ncbi:hypothetical protein VTL71DRAFT_5392 [Oculimacula yallundae]|uniref:Uncharacterized protein n=1 Tax=Oculimacula yallundae TaxID=86028 RepID=A0ABR4C202_9HELO